MQQLILPIRIALTSALLLIAPGLLPGAALSSAPEPVVLRAAVTSEGEIWVGQRVDLQVDVLARDGWAQVKRIRDFEVPGAYVVRLETQGTRLDETLSGEPYGGQRYEIALFPQQGGRISVPAIPVEVDIRRWGAPGVNESRQMKTPAVAFDVGIPPGAEGLQGLISTTELAAQQQWTPAAREFKVGDAVKRTIALAAPDLSGMALPPLGFPAVDGLGIYPGEPAVDDSYARGRLQGRRTESVTYVFEKEGAFELPAIEIPWWDVGRKQLKTAVLPALKVKIAAASGPGAGAAGKIGPQAEPGRRLLVLVLLLALVASSAWWFRITIRSRWQAWRRARHGTEQAYFRRLREACRQNDAMAAYQRLLEWLGHPEFDYGVATVKYLQGAGGREKLAREVSELEERLFKKPEGRDARTSWHGEALCRELTRWRKRFVKTKGATSPEVVVLASLNPN